MIEKKCFKCEEIKPLTEYYKHARMFDGHLNKCKVCTKKDAIKTRNSNLEHYRAYDRKRGARRTLEDLQNYRAKNKNKYKAHSIVNYAIKSKKLFKEPCEVCGTKKDIHAHHDDYLKPLNIRWLCPVHHFEWHKKNGEAKNGRNEIL